jgi:3-oxoacyl-[acyl-carrier protein] reductase
VSDFLLQLAESAQARKVIRTLGLPIPLPTKLRRADGPFEERPLSQAKVAVGAAPGAALLPAVALTLARAGADTEVAEADAAPFADVAEAYGRPVGRIVAGEARAALVFDATGIEHPEGLRALFDFFQPLLATLAPSGRVVVLARPAAHAASSTAAAARAALDGFVRSLAKEIGKRGATAQLLVVEPGAEARLEAVLRFVLSARSAFVTGQPIAIGTTAIGGGEPLFVRPLEGKVALVTGAARGIGEATARRLAAEGAHVVCLDRPADDGPASQVARAVGGTLLLADVTDPTAPAAIAAELRQGVDIVVHNAGVTRDKTLARMKPEMWDQALDINLAAITRIDEALAPRLRDGGRVICLASVAGIAGNVGQTNYAASKAGVIGYVRARAGELAARGITVNAVAPGFIETRLTAAIPLVIREAGRRLSALGQGGLPIDVAEVITFLATPGAVGVTGGVLRVCGGSLVGA